MLTADETPTRALPVRERTVFITTMLRPTIAAQRRSTGRSCRSMTGTTLEITGSQLRAEEITVVAFGGVEVAPPPDQSRASDRRRRAGGRTRRVSPRCGCPPPADGRAARASAGRPVQRLPRRHPAALLPLGARRARRDDRGRDNLRSGGITVQPRPAGRNRQQVTLLLNAVPAVAAGSGSSFEDERRDAHGEPDQTPRPGPALHWRAGGDYLLRVTVDGAETPLDRRGRRRVSTSARW